MGTPGRAARGRAEWLAFALAIAACSGSDTFDNERRDLRTADAGRDAAPADAEADAGEQPESDQDAGEDAMDAALDAALDAAMDAAPAPEAQAPEAGAVDAGEIDAEQTEDAAQDAGAPDASLTDAALADAAPDASLMPGATTPRNYLRAEDSPFAGVDFAWFHLEDFEDHQLNTPGLLSVTGPGSDAGAGVLSSSFGTGLIDSVDGDDGVPNDNRCLKIDGYCDAWWGPGALTFRFDVDVLGALPTHVGGVWTDGEGQVSFDAYGPDGVTVVYHVGPISEPGFPDDTVSSSTGEDRFFGAYSPAGISAFTVSNTAGGVEMDHVQYGRAR